MGGCCVYRFVQVFWWFELVQTHENRAFEDCSADLQVTILLCTMYISKAFAYRQVNPYLGAVIEGVATLLCRLGSRALGELGPKHAPIIDSFIGTSLVVAGKFLILKFSEQQKHSTVPLKFIHVFSI